MIPKTIKARIELEFSRCLNLSQNIDKSWDTVREGAREGYAERDWRQRSTSVECGEFD